MSLWKRAGCHTESKALEKLIVERIVRKPCLGFVKPIQNRLRKEQNLTYYIIVMAI